MKFVNLTPHSLYEVTTGTTIPTSGIIARVKSSTVIAGKHAGIPIYATEFGELEGLPEPVEGTMYVVSSLALNAVPAHRRDVVAPGNLVRDEAGQPIGCTGFRKL